MAGQIDQMRKGTTAVAILKLLADADQPLHGYEIIRRLEARSEGIFEFKEGLIYPRLHRMEQEGLLDSAWIGDLGTRRRKVYTLTDEGRGQLRADLEAWEVFRRGMSLLLDAGKVRL